MVRKNGFTLAEVLITLGIIGVVAAMTIPILITEHQKRATVTKLQRAISVLNQAYRLAYDDVGEASPEEALAMGSEKYFNTYWAPYVKVAHFCNTFSDCGYKSVDPFYCQNNNKCGSWVVANGLRATFYTPDGFLYVIFTKNGATNDTNKNIYLDINGGEKPNKFGRDVFVLTRSTDGEKSGVIQPYGYDKEDSEVNSECFSEGYFCAEKIRRAGWQIEKSYPWK